MLRAASTQYNGGRVGKTTLLNASSSSSSRRSSSQRIQVSTQASASKPWDSKKPCKLVLEDGSVWEGKAFGSTGTKIGEVVFNTSLSGYVLTRILFLVLLLLSVCVCVCVCVQREHGSIERGSPLCRSNGSQKTLKFKQKLNYFSRVRSS